MDKNKNLVEKGIFYGQVSCSEITEFYCGFFKIGISVFYSEFIVFLVKIKTKKTYLIKKIPNKYK